MRKNGLPARPVPTAYCLPPTAYCLLRRFVGWVKPTGKWRENLKGKGEFQTKTSCMGTESHNN